MKIFNNIIIITSYRKILKATPVRVKEKDSLRNQEKNLPSFVPTRIIGTPGA